MSSHILATVCDAEDRTVLHTCLGYHNTIISIRNLLHINPSRSVSIEYYIDNYYLSVDNCRYSINIDYPKLVSVSDPRRLLSYDNSARFYSKSVMFITTTYIPYSNVVTASFYMEQGLYNALLKYVTPTYKDVLNNVLSQFTSRATFEDTVYAFYPNLRKLQLIKFNYPNSKMEDVPFCTFIHDSSIEW